MVTPAKDLSEDIQKETQKMCIKLENEIKHVSFDSSNNDVKNEVTNLKAYISDCKHFMEKNDLVKAFEAIVFAWGIFEALSNLHLIKRIIL